MIEAGQPHGCCTAKGLSFTPENLEQGKAIIAKYPEGKQQSAIMGCCILRKNSRAGCPQRPLPIAPICWECRKSAL
jgi:hypothetical protein